MALTDRPNTNIATARNGALEMPVIGQIDGREYDEHVKATEVQEISARARRAWMKAYGQDPASARLNGSS